MSISFYYCSNMEKAEKRVDTVALFVRYCIVLSK